MARGEAAEEADNEPRGKQTEIVMKEMSQTTSQSETTVSNSALQLDLIRHQLEKDFSDLGFVAGYSNKDNQSILTVTQQEMHYHPPFGYTSRVHLVIKGNEYSWGHCAVWVSKN